MPDVMFNEPRISQSQREDMRETSSFANWLIKIGVAKTEKEATLILIGFSIIAIVVSLFLILNGTTKSPNKIPQYREDISEEAKKKLPPGVLETIPSKFQR